MSIAARSGRWLRRKLRQVGEGTLGRHGIHLPTVAWLILMPSLSNSPWMRGAPVLVQISTRLRSTGDFREPAVPSRHGDDSLRRCFDLRLPFSQPRLAGT